MNKTNRPGNLGGLQGDAELERGEFLFRYLGMAGSLHVLAFLARHGDTYDVAGLARELSCTQPWVSRRLGWLRRVGAVEYTRADGHHYYKPRPDALCDLIKEALASVIGMHECHNNTGRVENTEE